jgi:hypothetical protein
MGIDISAAFQEKFNLGNSSMESGPYQEYLIVASNRASYFCKIKGNNLGYGIVEGGAPDMLRCVVAFRVTSQNGG